MSEIRSMTPSKRLRSPLLALVALAAVACGGHEAGPAGGNETPPPAVRRTLRAATVPEIAAAARPGRPVLFVGLDAADWQYLDPLLARGEMPELARLVRESHSGVLETEHPPLSPILWTTMFTGVSPLEHGVLDFSRFRPGSGEREPIGSEERLRPALWNLASWAGRPVTVLGLWATYPAEPVQGLLVADRFFAFLDMGEMPPEGTVYPPERQPWAREILRQVEEEVGLKTMRGYLPDLGEEEYRRALEATRPYDDPVSALRRILVETRVYARLLAESWERDRPELAVLYLQGTDSIGHVFAPYYPPRQASVSPADFARFSGVADRYFHEIDRLLGEMRRLAAARGAVLFLASDHGFYWHEGRPERLSSFANATAAKWHRKEGMYLLHGPGLAPAPQRGRGGVRQVAPTLVSLLGLAPAAGMKAEPLPPVTLPAAAPFDYLPYFERERQRRLDQRPAVPGGGEEEIAKLRALGYVGAREAGRASREALALGEGRTAGSFNNEGLIHQNEGRKPEARRAFERALDVDPGLASAAWNLSDLLFAAGDLDRADEMLVRAYAGELPEGVRFVIGRAIGYQRQGEVARALRLLDAAIAARADEPEVLLFRGRYRIERGECGGALEDFLAAERLAPANPAAPASAAMAHLCLGSPAAARVALERSLALDPAQPRVRELLARTGG